MFKNLHQVLLIWQQRMGQSVANAMKELSLDCIYLRSKTEEH